VHGKQVVQTGATFTVALRKLNEEWPGLGMGNRWSIAAQMIASGQDFARDL
jgi:hypothetical protein